MMKRRITVGWFLFVLSIVATTGWCDERPEQWGQGGDDFSIDSLGLQCGWIVQQAVPADQWQPVAEPNLADQIGGVAELKLTDIAPPPNRCWVGRRPYLVPNPDGRSWDMVYPYYNKYRGVQDVVIHDFGSSRTRKQVLSTGEGDSVLTREGIGFHMKPSFYTEGKLVFEMYGALMFVVYDPAADAFVHGSKPFGEEVVNGRCTLGDDGMVYGLGWPKDKSGLVAYSFDPKTYETKRLETFGPSNEHRRELYGNVKMCGDWIYAAIGAEPWHLAAFNVKTGEGRLLGTTEEIIGDYQTIRLERINGGFSGHIRKAASILGIDDFDREEFAFWLHDGKVYPRTGDIPPWSDRPAQRDSGPRYNWQREFQVWPRDFTPPSPPPLIEESSADPDAQGHAELRYQPGGQEQWKTLSYDVQMFPGIVRLLTEINDHVLFATDEGYGQQVFYDLSSNRLKRIGGTLSPYSFGLLQDRLYVSGYPGSQMIEYDFTRPLGLRQEPSNPKRLGAPTSDTHTPLGGTIAGADGRVYNAGTTLGRRRIGGGMGWYDPATGQFGGFPMEDHRIFWMASAADDRYIVLSSKCEGQGKLFVWDTQTHEFRHTVDPPQGATRAGPIVEAMPGLILGHTVDGEDRPLLYGFDPASGKILWTKSVPSPPVTAFSLVRRQAYSFRRGPNGYIWTFFDKTLVRIDPRNARVEPLGRTEPAQLAFAAGGVYIAGGPMLRQIEGLSTDASPRGR
ncbi:MAG TPA: hypothetical protein VE890_06825 [Thermoguttaceae bacterium]|nr:hypothetical protein [Thermoguttaceae bacterium]